MSLTISLVVGLLERERELAALIGAVDRARVGHGSLVLVGGEAGIGKTSVVRALREHERERTRFLLGACEPLSVPIPLGPMRELFEAATGGDLVREVGDDRFALARAVIGGLAAAAPAVAVIEDAHWADPLTLDVLRLLARRVEETGVVIVVTYRDDEVEAHPALRLLLGDLASSPVLMRLAMRPLTDAAVRELAGPSGVDAVELARVTGGNPFLVVESILAGSRVPASVRDAALARVGRLSRAAREAVDAAAVFGQRFDAALLRRIAPIEAGAVDEAQASGVLVADGPSLQFRHELIREAIESSIAVQRRAHLHARAMEALSGDADHARLAHHAECAGLRREAAEYATLASAEAERVGALREACLQTERALRLGDDLGPMDRFELMVRYARTANFTNPDLEEAVRGADRAAALADELGDRVLIARAALMRAWTLWSLERVVEAKSSVERAISALDPDQDTAELATAYAQLARMQATAFDPASAIATGSRAADLAERAGLNEARVDAAISVGLARGHRGDPGALSTLQQALDDARVHGLTVPIVRAYVNVMCVAVAIRDHARAEQVKSEALPLLEEINAKLPEFAVWFFHARSLLDRGRWDEALAVATARERWWQGEFAVAIAIEGLVGARRGDPGANALLLDAWREIWELVSVEGSRHGMIRLARVEAAWLQGDRAAAIAELRAARDAPAVARFARSGSELALWGSRLGVELEVPPGAPEPVRLELAGDWRGAIAAWRVLEAPYEAALAALPGNERAARDALGGLHRLGATAAARAFARERAVRGARGARGPRRSTLEHPAGLTRRECEVLGQLATGATNASIAATLHLSERTVGHHVAAILHKLDAPNRWAAVEHARSSGLLTQDR